MSTTDAADAQMTKPLYVIEPSDCHDMVVPEVIATLVGATPRLYLIDAMVM